MIDHISIHVADYAKSREFYLKALAPLGYTMVMEFSREQIPQLGSPHTGGLGAGGKPDFWIDDAPTPSTPQHLAFATSDRANVDAFYNAAIAAGAKDNGPPGVRELYHPTYYGAFVIDVNGHNLEAVCHAPPK